MYKKDNRFTVPEPDAKIWRYMTLEKLYGLLKTECLYFCEISALQTDDPYEGSYYACKLLSQVGPREAETFAKLAKRCGPRFAVNCWHVSESECMAMWRIYAKKGKGVAVQSTLGRMVQSIQGVADNIYIGRITYTDTPVPDPTGAEANLFRTCMTKRKCFESERELRALVWETTQLARTDNGSALVPVDLSKLIECIYTSPTSPMMAEIVKSLVEKMQLNIQVRASTILSEPPY